MSIDPEIDAMSKTLDAVKGLDAEQQQRVMSWLLNKLGLSTMLNQKAGSNGMQNAVDNKQFDNFSDFETMADLFATVKVSTDNEKVLIVATFIQIKEEKRELTSREINDCLKHLGHGVSNITSAINGLVSKKPQLMIQTRKDGSSKQAQKKYKVTTEGIKEAKKIIYNNGDN